MEKIQLRQFSRSYSDARQFQISIRLALDEEAFYLLKIDDFLFYALNRIEEYTDRLEATSNSIEEHCKQVLVYFNYGEASSPEEFLLTQRQFISQAERFMYHILNLIDLPSQYYIPAKKVVENELHSLISLIKKYEEKSEMKEIQKNNGIPRNHTEKTVWDFYQRCIAEQRQILDFYLTGLRSRALYKASPKEVSGSFTWIEAHLDHPYKYGLNYNEGYFDYEKIEKVAHKFSDFPDAVVTEMVELYAKNKEEYYKRIAIEYPELRVFNEYNYYLSKIASKTNRREIFEELKILFTDKRWFGFYALALTQVEGLFTEMQLMIENKRKRDLSDKVETVRQGHPHDPSLDYYEYYIPNLRNKFLHVGHDDGIQYKAMDLFYDLSHILLLFSSLENPFQKLVNLIRNRNLLDFASIEQILAYFSLLDEISKKRKDQFEQIKSEIYDFEKGFLKQSCDIDFMAEELIGSLPGKIQTLVTECHVLFADVGVSIDLEKMNPKQIGERLNDADNIAKIREVFDLGDKFVEIIQAKLFMQEFKNWLPSFPEQLFESLSKSYEENRYMLFKIELFYKSI